MYEFEVCTLDWIELASSIELKPPGKGSLAKKSL